MPNLSNTEIKALQERFRGQYFSKYGPDDTIPGISGWGVGLDQGVLCVRIHCDNKRVARRFPDTFEGLPVHKIVGRLRAVLQKSGS